MLSEEPLEAEDKKGMEEARKKKRRKRKRIKRKMIRVRLGIHQNYKICFMIASISILEFSKIVSLWRKLEKDTVK